MLHRTNSLAPLFAPRSVALIGASENAARIGGRPLRYLRDGGFKGVVYPVNPNRDSVQGFKCYPSVQALPEAPDVAIATGGAPSLSPVTAWTGPGTSTGVPVSDRIALAERVAPLGGGGGGSSR